MISWILQKNLTNPKVLERIKSTLSKEGVHFEAIEIVPFADALPKIKNINPYKVIYGSTTFMLNAHNDKSLRQAVFYHPDTFQMKNYVDKWGKHVLNHDGILSTLGDLSRIKSKASKHWFIRPNHDGKEFSGRLDTFKNLLEWSEKICQLKLPDVNDGTEIWLSEPKIIEKEWRLFIVNDQIVSASRYMLEGQLNLSIEDVPDEMISFAQKRIKEYRLNDVYVMDIALSNAQFKIIECNCFNGTGFYEHDIEEIVKSINNFLRKKGEKLLQEGGFPPNVVNLRETLPPGGFPPPVGSPEVKGTNENVFT